MQYIISYNFNLLEILVKHYLNMNAKYHSSNMNDAHTMSPAYMSAALQKSHGQ